MSDTTFDRRELIVGAGAIAAAACLPVALAVAPPAVSETASRATLTDWHIDDMWGVYPRPSEPIGYGRPRGDGTLHTKLAAAQPADLPFINA
jgi:hypothetical protein